MSESRASLRKKLRHARRALSPCEQKIAARNIARILKKHPLFIRSSNIGFYIASDGEINPAILMHIARSRGKRTYLPVLHPLKKKQMWFAEFRKGDRLHNNYFNIPEPAPGSKKRPPFSLDLVIMPLVGFDTAGNRLGMGGGFYDRAFGFRKRWSSSKPALVGVAHQCQQVAAIDGESWDIPLDLVVTDQAIYNCKNPRKLTQE